MRESALPYSDATYSGQTGTCSYDETSAIDVNVYTEGFVNASSVTQMKAAI